MYSILGYPAEKDVLVRVPKVSGPQIKLLDLRTFRKRGK